MKTLSAQNVARIMQKRKCQHLAQPDQRPDILHHPAAVPVSAERKNNGPCVQRILKRLYHNYLRQPFFI
jgi:hypothetical protein